MIITEAIMESIIKALFSRKILDFDHFISLFTSCLTDIHVVETFLQTSPSLLILVSMISPSVQMYGFHFGLCGADICSNQGHFWDLCSGMCSKLIQ